MEGLTALAIIVSVCAQAVTLLVMHRTLRHQAARADVDYARRRESDRHERLRRAYGNILKAGNELDQAFRDHMFYPKGHPDTMKTVGMTITGVLPGR